MNLSEINNLKAVTTIAMSYNPFEFLQLNNLTNLNFLFLKSNKLKSLSIGSLPVLTGLQIVENKLTSLNIFSILPVLNSLDLRGNKFTEFINPSYLSYLPVLEYLDISENILKYVYISNMSKLLDLKLSNNNISIIKLQNLPNMKGIILSNNQLTSLVLENLSSLSYLSVSQNNLTTLSIGTLINTYNIQTLDLTSNYLTDISVLSGLKNLRSIFASNNRIYSFNFDLFLQSLPNLYDINLANNNLDGYFVFYSPNITVVNLDISNNKISTLLISNLTNLFSLSIYGNPLVSTKIYNSSIRILSFWNSKMNELILKNLNFLSWLNLYDLQIIEFSLVNLPVLETLFLKNLTMSTLPFINLPSLIRLEITGTIVQYFPNIEVHSNLKYLILTNSSLSYLPPEVFLIFPNIQTLDVSSNSLSSLNFPNLYPSLTGLYLSKNKFQSFPQTLLSLLPNLNFLDLSKNLIQDISVNSLAKLVKLDLTFNFLKNITRDTLKNLPSLALLYLNNNQIQSVELYNLPKLSQVNLSLQTLNLTNNKLNPTEIILSDDIIFKLFDLFLDSNNLTNLPVNFFDSYINLRRLSLKNSLLTNFSISKIPYLNNLDISFNKISKISLKNLSSLYYLNLAGNLLTKSSIFDHIPSLLGLNISSNKLTTLNQIFLSKSPNLAILDASNNQISQLDSYCFDFNTRLNKIYLSNNFLGVIPNISKITYLNLLDMSNQNGKLISIPAYAFTNENLYGPSLNINLKGNKIGNFSTKMLCYYTQPRININSFSIDCDLNINQCIYSNLASLLNSFNSYQNVTYCSKQFNETFISFCETQLQYKFYKVKTEYFTGGFDSYRVCPPDQNVAFTTTRVTTKTSITSTQKYTTTQKR